MRVALVVASLSLIGCYRSHGPARDGGVEDAPSCAARPELVCVRAADACGAAEVVMPECDPATLSLRCPAGAREHDAIEYTEQCLPFSDVPEIRRVAGTPVRVPTDRGCLWILPEVETASGAMIENAGVLLDPALPFGGCPTNSEIFGGELSSVVEVSSGEAPIVQLTGSYRIGAGPQRVVFRHFVPDPAGGFGVRAVGTGIGTWDAARGRAIVPGTGALRWSPEVDLGDAVYAAGDHAFLYGCPGPPEFLSEQCVLGRVATDDVAEMWAGDRWSADERDAAFVFDAGPWRSSVVRLADARYVHLYAVGFGTRIEAHVATAPEGPWRRLGILAECDLPDDPGAYCAGPMVHEELIDPLAPSMLVVSYGVGSTTPGWPERARESPREYWPRLVRIAVP